MEDHQDKNRKRHDDLCEIDGDLDVHARDPSMRVLGGTPLAAPAIGPVEAPLSSLSPHG
jgi:hypothetical protein